MLILNNRIQLCLQSSLLENNPSMKSDEMGIKLEEKFTKKWKSGSRIRYGNAVIVWVKYLAATDHNEFSIIN